MARVSARTLGRGRGLARYLASVGGMVAVHASNHRPLGDATPEDKRVLFNLECPPPFGTVRAVSRNRLYTQREWLTGATGDEVRIAAEAFPRGSIDDALIAMSARSFAILTTLIADQRLPEMLVWLDRPRED